MTEALAYASPPTPRWSRMSYWSLGIALLHIPLFFGIEITLQHLHLINEVTFQLLAEALLVPAFVASVLGIISTCRSLTSNGELRGWPLGALALLISSWPIAYVVYLISNLSAGFC